MIAYVERTASRPQVFSPAEDVNWFYAKFAAVRTRIGHMLDWSEDMVWNPETETLKPATTDSFGSLFRMHPAVLSTKIFDR